MNDSEKLVVEMPRFVMDYPSHTNAYRLRADTWKYDYENLTQDEIIAKIKFDARPRYCAETFPGFDKFSVVELGPSDGYNTAGIEIAGARDIVAVEANADGFLKACILKNTLNLRAQFLLGDFIKFLKTPGLKKDLVYASGVLYHLTDPVEFIQLCGKVADNLFLWTFHYVEESIAKHDFERRCFDKPEARTIGGETFTYYKRFYDPNIVGDPKYQGGVDNFAYWLTFADIERALGMAGFKIKRTVDDSFNGIEAVNILASKR
jgi:hypothetical protein